MDYESVRVVDRPTAWRLANLSRSTWERLEARGEAPPKTRLSANRTGYRLSDLKAWLDARRIGEAPGSQSIQSPNSA
jgi:predicted DNA-binding transcriptional regulator AlpA